MKKLEIFDDKEFQDLDLATKNKYLDKYFETDLSDSEFEALPQGTQDKYKQAFRDSQLDFDISDTYDKHVTPIFTDEIQNKINNNEPLTYQEKFKTGELNYKDTTPDSWNNKIAKDFEQKKDIASMAVDLSLNQKIKAVPTNKHNNLIYAPKHTIDVPLNDDNVIDQVQSSLIQQSRESARAVSKFSKRGLKTIGLDIVGDKIPVPKAISQDLADEIAGYSKANRTQDKFQMQDIRKDWDNNDWGKALLKATKHLPSILADSSGEMIQLLTLPSTALAIGTRVSKFEDEYIKNNKGKSPSALWYAEALATQSALLLGERFGLKVLGKTLKSTKPKTKLGIAGGIVGGGAFEGIQEFGETVSQTHLTQKDGAKTLGEIASSDDAKFSAFMGGVAGTTLKGGAEVIGVLRRKPTLEDELNTAVNNISSQEIQDIYNKDKNKPTILSNKEIGQKLQDGMNGVLKNKNEPIPLTRDEKILAVEKIKEEWKSQELNKNTEISKSKVPLTNKEIGQKLQNGMNGELSDKTQKKIISNEPLQQVQNRYKELETELFGDTKENTDLTPKEIIDDELSQAVGNTKEVQKEAANIQKETPTEIIPNNDTKVELDNTTVTNDIQKQEASDKGITVEELNTQKNKDIKNIIDVDSKEIQKLTNDNIKKTSKEDDSDNMLDEMIEKSLRMLATKKAFNSYDYKDSLKEHNEIFNQNWQDEDINYQLEDFNDVNFQDMDYSSLPPAPNNMKYMKFYDIKSKKNIFTAINDDYVLALDNKRFIEVGTITQDEARIIKLKSKNGTKKFDIIPRYIAKQYKYKSIKDIKNLTKFLHLDRPNVNKNETPNTTSRAYKPTKYDIVNKEEVRINDPDKSTILARHSKNTGDYKQTDKNSHDERTNATTSNSGQNGNIDDEANATTKQSSDLISGGDSTIRRESSNKQLSNTNEPIQSKNSTSGNSEPIGSSGANEQGTSPKSSAATSTTGTTGKSKEEKPVEKTLERGFDKLTFKEKLQLQINVEDLPVILGDISNIKETLPVLLEDQQLDVLKAEKRFFNFEPDDETQGKGMLFTNGTGTGKTYTGLGIVKRFLKRKLTSILILVPTDVKAKDWIEDGQNVQVEMTQLNGIKDKGTNTTITTYANFYQNEAVHKKNWDLVVYDESHYLQANQTGEVTATTQAHFKTTNSIGHLMNGYMPSDKNYMQHLAKAQKKSAKTKVVFLSATPFKGHKSLKYANGYLFEMGGGSRTGAYNAGSSEDTFYINNFGYKMRYNKLNRPDKEVNVGYMERKFSDMLISKGAMSARSLKVNADYSREFIDVLNNHKFQDALNTLFDHKSIKYDNLRKYARQRFYNYIESSQLYESIKAKQVIPRIKEHLALGRKVVLFHRYKSNPSGVNSPFDFRNAHYAYFKMVHGKKTQHTKFIKDDPKALEEALLFQSETNFTNIFNGYENALTTLKKEFATDLLLFNGSVSKKKRKNNIESFNDNKKDLILIQEQAGKEGISLHDIDGDKQRVLINLGIPDDPIAGIQIEGRTYRTAVKSDAIYEYPILGISSEAYTFGTKINERVGTVENLAMGNGARALKEQFKLAYENAHTELPNKEQGKGGKKADINKEIANPFDNAISDYFAKGKGKKNHLGKDYFATPEPIGLKMVEWSDIKAGEDALEPSVGHGAIGKFFPENSNNTFIEMSFSLADMASINVSGKIVRSSFEAHSITNKYDSIIMNPPFGVGGKIAMEHLSKAYDSHLRDRGRAVVLVPSGASMNKSFNKWLNEIDKKEKLVRNVIVVADIALPIITFERAGTKVASRILILDKNRSDSKYTNNIDLSGIDNITELFKRLKDISIVHKQDNTINNDSLASSNSSNNYMAKPNNIVKNPQGFKSFLNQAKKIKDKLMKYKIEDISKEEKQELSKKYKFKNPDNIKRVINNYQIHHIINNHGDIKSEESRGNMAIRDTDILNYPNIIHSSDLKIYSKNKNGIPTIVYGKQLNKEYFIIVEEIRTGKHELSLHTMRISKGKLTEGDLMLSKDKPQSQHPKMIPSYEKSIAQNTPNSQDGTKITPNESEDENLYHKAGDSVGINYIDTYGATELPTRPKDNIVNIGSRKVDLPTLENPTNADSLRVYLSDIIGGRLYDSKIKNKSALGVYKRNDSAIRVKNHSDIEVMAHELAHYLDFFHNNKTKKAIDSFFRSAIMKNKDEVKGVSYTTNPKLELSEGFAEFTRLWLTNYNAVNQVAPNMVKDFEAKLKKDKNLYTKMITLQEGMHSYYFQGADVMLRSKRGGELDSTAKKIQRSQIELGKDLRQKAIDKLHTIKRIETEILGDTPADAMHSAYKSLQMVNGHSSIMYSAMNNGIPFIKENGDITYSGKSLNAIFKPATSKGEAQVRLLEDYLVAKRASELKEQGRENLITDQEITAGLKLVEANPEFETIFNDYQDFNDGMLDFYVDMKLITTAQRENFKEFNKNYVPFHRITESVQYGTVPPSKIGQRLTGGTHSLGNIMENIIDGIESNIKEALISRGKSVFYKMLEDSGMGGVYATRVGTESKLVKADINRQAKNMAMIMAQLGITVSKNGQIISGDISNDPIIDISEIEENLLLNPTALEFFTHGHKPTSTTGYIDSAIIDDKIVYFETNDIGLVDAITSFRSNHYNEVVQGLMTVKNVMTWNITNNPLFYLANFTRDTVSAGVLSKNNFIPVVNSVKGMYHFITKSNTFKEFMASGAGYGTRRTTLGSDIQAMQMLEVNRKWDILGKIISGMEYGADVFEYGTRIGDFALAKKEKKSNWQGGFESREVSTDFAIKGSDQTISGFLATVPFMKAGINGIDKTARRIFSLNEK